MSELMNLSVASKVSTSERFMDYSRYLPVTEHLAVDLSWLETAFPLTMIVLIWMFVQGHASLLPSVPMFKETARVCLLQVWNECVH